GRTEGGVVRVVLRLRDSGLGGLDQPGLPLDRERPVGAGRGGVVLGAHHPLLGVGDGELTAGLVDVLLLPRRRERRPVRDDRTLRGGHGRLVRRDRAAGRGGRDGGRGGDGGARERRAAAVRG